ncbi:response regulator [Zunongwangia sp. SCSIO 43204]|uniref:response regulator transcription factor n=1 Tax=Zunongwangia sp. SCSIO 43204 TaxID=2779359 RepID=UPI001CA90278|nr:response regulator [Zunongwangia sp. SCSIO 43204]UAB85079.1 response regulator [Zunongwangia sp. SCSIO 43204]
MKNILLVEDSLLIERALSFRLKHSGYNVIHALNGKKAIEILENNRIDLILTDLVMPEGSGQDFLEYVFNHGYEIPCLVLSSITEETTITKLLDRGIVDYITKPFRPEEIHLRIRRALGTYKFEKSIS